MPDSSERAVAEPVMRLLAHDLRGMLSRLSFRVEMASLDTSAKALMLDDIQRIDWMLGLYRDLVREKPTRPLQSVELGDMFDRILAASPGFAAARLLLARPLIMHTWPEVFAGVVRACLLALGADRPGEFEISVVRGETGCQVTIARRSTASPDDAGVRHSEDIALQTAHRLAGMLGGEVRAMGVPVDDLNALVFELPG